MWTNKGGRIRRTSPEPGARSRLALGLRTLGFLRTLKGRGELGLFLSLFHQIVIEVLALESL